MRDKISQKKKVPDQQLFNYNLYQQHYLLFSHNHSIWVTGHILVEENDSLHVFHTFIIEKWICQVQKNYSKRRMNLPGYECQINACIEVLAIHSTSITTQDQSEFQQIPGKSRPITNIFHIDRSHAIERCKMTKLYVSLLKKKVSRFPCYVQLYTCMLRIEKKY